MNATWPGSTLPAHYAATVTSDDETTSAGQLLRSARKSTSSGRGTALSAEDAQALRAAESSYAEAKTRADDLMAYRDEIIYLVNHKGVEPAVIGREIKRDRTTVHRIIRKVKSEKAKTKRS